LYKYAEHSRLTDCLISGRIRAQFLILIWLILKGNLLPSFPQYIYMAVLLLNQEDNCEKNWNKDTNTRSIWNENFWLFCTCSPSPGSVWRREAKSAYVRARFPGAKEDLRPGRTVSQANKNILNRETSLNKKTVDSSPALHLALPAARTLKTSPPWRHTWTVSSMSKPEGRPTIFDQWQIDGSETIFCTNCLHSFHFL